MATNIVSKGGACERISIDYQVIESIIPAPYVLGFLGGHKRLVHVSSAYALQPGVW